MSISDKVVEILSGEWMLEGRANGGTIIAKRSTFTSGVLFLIAIGIDSRLAPNATWALSAEALAASIREHLPWWGALWGGCYAALYSRFSSQWAYLAGLYNQLMQMENQAPRSGLLLDQREKRMLWWHAFIEDARILHLALKPSYATVIWILLKEPEIEAAMLADPGMDQAKLDGFKESLRQVRERDMVASKHTNRVEATSGQSNNDQATAAE